MRIRIWAIAIPLVLVIALTGCNLMPGTGEEHSESAQPLNAATWPTPQPTAVQASPTPFPKITLAPTPTPTTRPPSEATSATPIAVEELTFTGDVGALVQQVTQLSGGFPPTAAAVVKVDEATIRQGPDDSYGKVGVAQEGELAAVLGKNTTGDWMYVLTRSVLQGWLPTDVLQITFSLGLAPTLPDDPRASEPPQMEAYPSGAADFLGGLEPVAVALVTTEAVTVRQGPATTYASTGIVEQGELAGVLGINASRDWLYVVTISVVQGWLPADSVRVMGSLAEAPLLPANPLAADMPSITSSPTSATSSSPTNTTTPPSQPLELASLDPITTARVANDGLNFRQGPGAAYELLGTLSRDDQVSVLAINNSQDWLLVKTADGNFGWVSLEYLTPDGSLADVPQVISPAPDRELAPGQVAPVFPVPVESSSVIDTETQTVANTTHMEPSSAASPEVSRLDLTPVTTARAKRASVDLYRGPGTSYEPIVTLAVDERVSVLAISQDRNWLLVKPLDHFKSPGWVPIQELIVDGSLGSAPQVTTAWVDSNELAVRRGPGIFYEEIGTLAINDLVAVLGRNQGESWSLVQPIIGGGPGWIPVHFLTLTGSWPDIPLAPTTVLAAADASHGPVGRPTGTGNSTDRPGRIVFQLSSGGDIMVINPDGTGLRRLTHGIDPALSPDGQTVAFTRWTGEDGTLWLINVEGSNERAALGGTKQAKHPSWSPDGQRIVINFQHGGRLDPQKVCKNLIELGDRNPNIPWNVDLDSVGVEIDDGLPYLCWTLPPDPHWGLRVINLADGSFDDVPSDAYAFGPEWDPANPWRIVSSGLQGLVQLDVNRTEQWTLTERGEDHTPAFSPDGRYIAVAFNNHGHYDIHLLNSDGSGRIPLTKTPIWVTAQPSEQKPWNNVSPAWSPDGSQIAFLTDRTGRWEIWAMSANGSNQHPVFSAEVNDQLQITHSFVDERMLSWR